MIEYEDRLELAWEAAEELDERDAERMDAHNLAVLHGVAAVEEGVSHRLREEQPELYNELERLNARVDLLIDMVGRLLSEHRAPGPRRKVRMAVARIGFVAADEGEGKPGQRGWLRLLLHPSVPEPLILAGRISGEARDGQDRRWLRFEPFEISGRLRDALGQLVFRHHRRMVAEQRSRRDHAEQG